MAVRQELGHCQFPQKRRRSDRLGRPGLHRRSRAAGRGQEGRCSSVRSPALTGPDIGADLLKAKVEYWLAPSARTSAAGAYAAYHPANARVATMGSFTYVLPNVRTWSEIDQKVLRPATDAVLEGKTPPKQALAQVAPQPHTP